ncbi:MAG: membrane protein [Herpetosiphon sp.]
MPGIQVIGVLPSEDTAGQLVGNLRLAGITQQDISLLEASDHQKQDLAQDDSEAPAAVTNITKKVVTGGMVGLVFGVAIAFAIVHMPGLGPLIATGILMAMFGGMGFAIGALLGLYATERVTNQVVNRYGMSLRQGQIVVAVAAADTERAKQVEDMFRKFSATNVNSYMADQNPIGAEASSSVQQKPAT